MSISDLIGKPWALPCDPPASFDCWELAVAVRDRLGLVTPKYEVAAENRTAAHRASLGKPDPTIWKRLDKPRDGCLVGFGGRFVRHCGVFYRGKIIHAHGNLGHTVCQDVSICTMTMGKPTYWETV